MLREPHRNVNKKEQQEKKNCLKTLEMVRVCLVGVKHVGHAVLMVLFDSARELEIEGRVALATEEDS